VKSTSADIESIIEVYFQKNDLLEQKPRPQKYDTFSTNAVCAANVRRTDFVNLSSSSQTLICWKAIL